MNNAFNKWWLLPLMTFVIGGLSAFAVHQSKPAMQATSMPIEKAPIIEHDLSITQVALPPAPVIYQPTLIATKVNNRVVINKNERDMSKKLVPAVNSSHSDSGVQSVSSDQSALAAKFNQVLKDMENEKTQPQPTAKLHAQALTLYPQWYQDLVPDLEFSSHIFSSEANERWVRVNNQVVKEGELINSNMRLVAIEPQQVIIEMQQRRFSLPALSSW